MDGPSTTYSPLTQPRRPKRTRAERLALATGFTLTAEQYHAVDGGHQDLYA